MIGKWKTSQVILMTIGVAFLVGTALNTAVVLQGLREQSLREAEEKARILLDRNLAAHTYFSQIMKPKLLAWSEPFRGKDHFEPSWMSSTYAIREIHRYFGTLNPQGYYVKDAAINARSPENEADDVERAFLTALQGDPRLASRTEVRTIDGKPYLTVLRRGEVMEASCMICHDRPAAAPRGLVELYGPERSFHRQVGETISAISMRIPLSAAYAGGYRTALNLSLLLAAVLLLLFGAQYLLYRRFLISPLAVFREKALAIAAHQEDLGGEVHVAGGREIVELTRAFNAMSRNLRTAMDDLERRVAERTRELETANGELTREIAERQRANEALAEEHARLLKALDEVKTLQGIIPICSNCKKIRDDQGYWNQVEQYVSRHTGAEFSHGICPACIEKLYPDLAK